jgi:membrane protease YdiL (CAAX protease family)
MVLESLNAVLTAIIGPLFILAGLFVYLSLARQIAARGVSESSPLEMRHFGFPEAIVATLLAIWFLLNVWVALTTHRDISGMHTRELVANALFTIGLVCFLFVYLRLRGFDVAALAGFSKLGFGRILSTGIILLFAAYPLIYLADLLTRRALGTGLGRQEIIDLFNGSQTLTQRMIIIIMAVLVAPIAEEFVFRFYIYGVLKRYLGVFFGVTINALLFATVHTHLPSFVPLFVLGCCFTIAYEWSGSILVSMTMHSLFNALTLTLLAFPQPFPQ